MKYQQCKSHRIKNSRFDDVTTYSDYWMIRHSCYWKQSDNIDFSTKQVSTHSHKVRSLRAFRRRLKQWKDQLPKGTEMILASKYMRHHIIGVIK